jgi:hypothetical protein
MRAVEIHWDDMWAMLKSLSAGNVGASVTTDAYAYIRVSVKKSIPIALSLARVMGREQILIFGSIIDVVANSYIKGVTYDPSSHIIVFQDINFLFHGMINICDELLSVPEYAHKDITPLRRVMSEALRHIEANLVFNTLCELSI